MQIDINIWWYAIPFILDFGSLPYIVSGFTVILFQHFKYKNAMSD